MIHRDFLWIRAHVCGLMLLMSALMIHNKMQFGIAALKVYPILSRPY